MRRNLLIYTTFLCVFIALYFFIPGYFEFWNEIVIGIVSSVILLIAMEIRDYYYDRKILGYLEGKYSRLSFHNENKNATVDTRYKEVANYRPSEITLKYLGQGEYWVPEIRYDEGIVKATLFLDKVNRHQGSGTYQYVETVQSVDIGIYTFYVNELDKTRLYIFHQNILPSGLSHGYEEWRRISKI